MQFQNKKGFSLFLFVFFGSVFVLVGGYFVLNEESFDYRGDASGEGVCVVDSDCRHNEPPYEVCHQGVCLVGDINNDGSVGVGDFLSFRQDFLSFRKEGWDDSLLRSDLNQDSSISIKDYGIFVLSYMKFNGLKEGKEDVEVKADELFSFDKIVDRGYVITDDTSYNYAPSIMLDDGLYRMWWCAKDEGDGDSIFYAESSDGMKWSEPKIVLRAIYGGEQGHWACDPSVVKASNNYYYLFFTSEHPRFWENEDYSHPDNQIFLATSKDGINWNHANNRNPVISLPKEHQQMHYGIGQSSVIFMENRFIHFYSYAIDPHLGPWGTYVSESTDGGRTFTPLNNGESVSSEKEGSDDIFSSVDVKYLPERDKFILVADTGQGSIMFRLLDRDFNIIGRMSSSAGWPELGNKDLVNHNPGILGDEKGFVVDEKMVPVFFGSGERGFENSSTWDMRRADLYLEWGNKAEGSLEPSPVKDEFCSLSSDYDSVRAINGDIVYCDKKGNIWSVTGKKVYSFRNAFSHCRDLRSAPGGAYAGRNEWILPTWEQLRNLFGVSACDWPSQEEMGACVGNCSACSLDWDDNMGSYYWTSSVYDNEFSWYVGFDPSGVGATQRDDKLHVRCFIPSSVFSQ